MATIQPLRAVFVVAVAIAADALDLPMATCRAVGTVTPVKPLRPIVSALGVAQLRVAVTVELAPPGTDAGDSVTFCRVGEHVAAGAAAADCRGTVTAAAVTSSTGSSSLVAAPAFPGPRPVQYLCTCQCLRTCHSPLFPV